MILRRLLHFLSGYLPLRIVSAERDDGRPGTEPLFERYFLGQMFGWTLYLHHYLRSDPDRGPHDHPWNWAITLPLCEGYIEERLVGYSAAKGLHLRWIIRLPGLPYRLTGNDFHRVLIPQGHRSSWSLFIHGPRRKSWGFLRLARAGDPPPQISTSYTVQHDEEDSRRWWEDAAPGRQIERAAP